MVSLRYYGEKEGRDEEGRRGTREEMKMRETERVGGREERVCVTDSLKTYECSYDFLDVSSLDQRTIKKAFSSD